MRRRNGFALAFDDVLAVAQWRAMDVGSYLAVKDRVAGLVKESDPQLPVPSCPAWSVRDAVAHLSGLCEDWVDHRLDGYASQVWTGAQVARFAEQPLADILGRWDVAGEALRLPFPMTR